MNLFCAKGSDKEIKLIFCLFSTVLLTVASTWQQIPNHSWGQSFYTWATQASLSCIVPLSFFLFYVLLENVPIVKAIVWFSFVFLGLSDWCKMIKCLNKTVLVFCHYFVCSASEQPSIMLHACFCWCCSQFSYTCSRNYQQRECEWFMCCIVQLLGKAVIKEIHLILPISVLSAFIGSLCDCKSCLWRLHILSLVRVYCTAQNTQDKMVDFEYESSHLYH